MCKACGDHMESTRHAVYMKLQSFAAVGSGASLALLNALEEWAIEIAFDVVKDFLTDHVAEL